MDKTCIAGMRRYILRRRRPANSYVQANGAYTLTERKILSCADVTKSLQWDDDPLRTRTSVGRIEKEDLARVRVVGQVDRKFVACVLDSESGSDAEEEAMLILIDQHAADERVRVERYLKELCLAFRQHDSPSLSPAAKGDYGIAEDLDPPCPVLLTRREAARVRKSEETRKMFEKWGIKFVETEVAGGDTVEEEEEEELDILKIWRVPPKDKGRKQEKECGYAQVMVRSVPTMLREKLLMNDELRDMIRSMLAHLEIVGFPSTSSSFPSTPTPTPTPTASQSQPVWQRALRWCPPHLLDLINSKACRGAIMFNDPLTVEQCERLVGQLARTDAPFQCAHGRPSLVPLVSHRGRVSNHADRRLVDWAKFEQSGRGGVEAETGSILKRICE